jgi:hypothetical protein
MEEISLRLDCYCIEQSNRVLEASCVGRWVSNHQNHLVQGFSANAALIGGLNWVWAQQSLPMNEFGFSALDSKPTAIKAMCCSRIHNTCKAGGFYVTHWRTKGLVEAWFCLLNCLFLAALSYLSVFSSCCECCSTCIPRRFQLET